MRKAIIGFNPMNSGEEFQTSGRDNLNTLKMAFGTYESTATHQVIFL